jgi:hypothetical protein
VFPNNVIREVEVDNGRKLRIYNDVFDMEYRQNLYSFAQGSLYRIGWADGPLVENKKHQFLHSTYSPEDLERIELLHRLKATPVAQEMEGFNLTKCVMNLSTPSDTNFVHTHPQDKVLLYYINLDWRDGWHGETLFYDEPGREVVFASAYTPNRLIAFDAKIPHTIRPQSSIAPHYRLTLALIYTKC